MNSIRPTRRLLRNSLSYRSPHLAHVRQWHSTRTRAAQVNSLPFTAHTNKPRRRLRPFIWALAFTAAGFSMGKMGAFDNIELDSQEDLLVLKSIMLAADEIPIVAHMLKHDGDVDAEWEEVAVVPEEGDTMVNDTLRGSMGLVLPRAFWNEVESELWMVVYYGGALCGWPGIAHGGCTATVLLEGMGRGLNRLTGSTQSMRPPEPSSLGLTYLKPVKAGQFYMLKAKLNPSDGPLEPETSIGADKDLAKRLDRETGRIKTRLNTKYEVDCTLEDLKGLKCMKAKGVWTVL